MACQGHTTSRISRKLCRAQHWGSSSRQARGILAVEIRSRPKRKDLIPAPEGQIGESAGNDDGGRNLVERKNARRARSERPLACGRAVPKCVCQGGHQGAHRGMHARHAEQNSQEKVGEGTVEPRQLEHECWSAMAKERRLSQGGMARASRAVVVMDRDFRETWYKEE